VEGINNIQTQYEELYGPGDYIPLVALDYWMFRIMVAIGFLMIAVSAICWFFSIKKFPQKWTRYLFLLIPGIALPYLANTAGWLLTETSRQPWVVHGLMQTKDAVSPNLTVTNLLISLFGFLVIYIVLMGFTVFLLVKTARKGLTAGDLESLISNEVDKNYTSGGNQ